MESLVKKENNLMLNSNQYVVDYLNYLDVSDLTIKEYYSGIKRFFEYCADKHITQVKREDIIQFREELKQEGKEPSTINLYLASVKSFFKWLEYEEIYKDITKNVKSLPISETHKREPLSIEQVKDLLSFCENDKERLIINIAITTGLRCNEICNIRLRDFTSKDDTILLYVLGKARQGMKTDCVVIPDKLYGQIMEYAMKNHITDYLFISSSNNNKGDRLSTRAMRNIVNKIYEKAGIKSKEIVFHSLRHTNATLSIKNGADIREVSQNLRHKSINTTMKYLHDLEITNNKCSNLISNMLF